MTKLHAVNINDTVRFKLTPVGIRWIKGMNRSLPEYKKYPLDWADKEGEWVEASLWEFSSAFGPTFVMGLMPPVEPNIQIIEKD